MYGARVILVGLTGGIGSGKSTVSAQLVSRGAVVIDADGITRELQAAGSPLLAKLAARFGDDIIRPDGELDRPALAAVAFGDAEALKALNAIVHPAVGAEIRDRTAAQVGTDHVVILDVPLMAENDGKSRYAVSAVVVVDTPIDVAVERLIKYRGFDEDDARARIGRQATREQRLAIADRVIDNGGSPEHLAVQMGPLWEWLHTLPEYQAPGEHTSA